MAPPTVSGFDPDAPDPAWDAGDPAWAVGGDGLPVRDLAGDLPAHHRRPDRDGSATGPEADVWIDPFDDAGEQWAEPFDDVLDDSPTARADRAYGAVTDPATPATALRAALEDLATWDVEGLLAEAAVLASEVGDGGPLAAADRPEVVVLRSALRHPNRPDDLADVLLRGWLEDPVERSPWPAVVAAAHDATPADPDLLVTAVTEATDAARSDPPPAWSLLLTAAAAARSDAGPVLDLLALVGFPHDEPSRLWPDADQAAKGMPGGVRARARAGAESLGWDGRRLPDLPEALTRELARLDRQRRASSFAATLELCPHGPVVVTPTSVTLPSSAAGPKPYVALIVGSHPVFRLKRDWPDRSDGATGTIWTWDGPRVLESRGLGCARCRQDRDRDKRYLLSTGDAVADVRLSQVQRVIEQLEDPPHGGED